MASNVTKMTVKLGTVVSDLAEDYAKARDLFNKAGLDATLKENSLQAMANALQLQSVAIQNYANWKHVLREDDKLNYDKKLIDEGK
jgi:hypothetical protein